MSDTSFTALLVRTVVSLAIVLAVIGVAFVVARRRAVRGGARPSGRRTATTGRSSSSLASITSIGRRPRRSAPGGVDVVGRVGLSRTTAAVAIRFGDRVVLVAAADQAQSTVLAEMSAEEWDELNTVREPIDDVEPRTDASGAPRPSFVEALRDATARRAS